MLTQRTHPAPTLQHLWPALEEQLRGIPGYEQTSQRIAQSIHAAVLKGGSPARAVVDALHGTWLGHPLHVVLVHLPLGSWIASSIFDLVAAATGSRQAASNADALIALGALSAVPTALTGVADFSAASEDVAVNIATHALLNEVALGLYLISLTARRAGNRQLGVLLSTLALGVVGASAAIGGDLVYRKRVGVDRTPPLEGQSGDWSAVMPAEDLGIGEPQRVMLGEEPVLLYRDLDAIHAISAVCSHAGAPLEEGRFDGHCVECPWHQSVFDVRDGRVIHGPAVHPQPRYDLRVRDGQIELRRPASGQPADADKDKQQTVGDRA